MLSRMLFSAAMEGGGGGGRCLASARDHARLRACAGLACSARARPNPEPLRAHLLAAMSTSTFKTVTRRGDDADADADDGAPVVAAGGATSGLDDDADAMMIISLRRRSAPKTGALGPCAQGPRIRLRAHSMNSWAPARRGPKQLERQPSSLRIVKSPRRRGRACTHPRYLCFCFIMLMCFKSNCMSSLASKNGRPAAFSSLVCLSMCLMKMSGCSTTFEQNRHHPTAL